MYIWQHPDLDCAVSKGSTVRQTFVGGGYEVDAAVFARIKSCTT